MLSDLKFSTNVYFRTVYILFIWKYLANIDYGLRVSKVITKNKFNLN